MHLHYILPVLPTLQPHTMTHTRIKRRIDAFSPLECFHCSSLVFSMQTRMTGIIQAKCHFALLFRCDVQTTYSLMLISSLHVRVCESTREVLCSTPEKWLVFRQDVHVQWKIVCLVTVTSPQTTTAPPSSPTMENNAGIELQTNCITSQSSNKRERVKFFVPFSV